MGSLRTDVTVYYMVKNEDKWIRASIETAKRHVDDILVVDTGSEDNTVAEVKKTGVRLIEHPRFSHEEFSMVKTHYLDTEVLTDVALFIDGNEIITDKGFKALKRAFRVINLSDYAQAPTFSIPQYEVISIQDDVGGEGAIVEYYDRPTGRRRLLERTRVYTKRGFGRAVCPRRSKEDKGGVDLGFDIKDSLGMFWHMRFMGQSSLDGSIVDHMYRIPRNDEARVDWDRYPKKTMVCSNRVFTGETV